MSGRFKQFVQINWMLVCNIISNKILNRKRITCLCDREFTKHSALITMVLNITMSIVEGSNEMKDLPTLSLHAAGAWKVFTNSHCPCFVNV